MFYDQFYHLCVAYDVSPAKVAEDLKLNKSTVYMWKTQATTPRGKTLQKIADYFDVSAAYLVGDTAVFSKNLQSLRHRKKIAETGMLQLTGIDSERYRRIERGLILPTTSEFQKIVSALGVEPTELDPDNIVESYSPPRPSTVDRRRKVEELLGKEADRLDSPLPTGQSETGKRLHRILAAFDAMSEDGQEEATRRVEELARLPEYQKKESPSPSSLWGFARRGEDAVDPKENE